MVLIYRPFLSGCYLEYEAYGFCSAFDSDGVESLLVAPLTLCARVSTFEPTVVTLREVTYPL